MALNVLISFPFYSLGLSFFAYQFIIIFKFVCSVPFKIYFHNNKSSLKIAKLLLNSQEFIFLPAWNLSVTFFSSHCGSEYPVSNVLWANLLFCNDRSFVMIYDQTLINLFNTKVKWFRGPVMGCSAQPQGTCVSSGGPATVGGGL